MGYAGQITAERTAEELLIEFERTGRPEPFEEIVRRYSGMVYHVCHRITRDRHDAEDATQAVFSALAVGRKKESGEIRTIGPWLRQVARRTSLDIRRGKKRRQRRETLCANDGATIDSSPDPAEKNGIDAEELKQLIKDELDKLPVKYRLPLVLHYFGGMSQDEMATELGCRPGTLRVRLHRGRHMLARRLAKRGIAVGTLVFAVAITRAVQSALNDAVGVQLAHGQAATAAAGVIQAASAPAVHVAHGMIMPKMKVACIVVLAAACVVRAGAEVYQYIRPLQLRLPVPLNLDSFVPSLFDSFDLPIRADATPQDEPVAPLAAVPRRVDPLPVLPAHVPVTPVTLPPVAVAKSTVTGVPAPSARVSQPMPPIARTPDRVLGSIHPTYTRPQAAPASLPVIAGGGRPEMLASAAPVGPLASKPGATGRTPDWTPRYPNDPTANNPAPTPTPVPPTPVTPTPGGGGTANPNPPVRTAIVLAPTSPPVWGGGAKPGSSGGVSGPLTDAFTPAGPSTSYDSVGTGPVSTPETTIHQTATTLSGHGVVPPTPVLDNSGIVYASAPIGKLASLDLSAVESVTNSVDNPSNGRNGWYAGPRSSLVLPSLAVAAGTNSYSWGENPSDATPDLVNSVRLTLNDVAAPGTVGISLVAPDRPDAPLVPPTERVIGLWRLDTNATIAGGIDLLIRYDAYKAYSLGATDDDVRLIDFRTSWRQVADSTLVRDPAEHLVGGRVGNVYYFAVSVPADPVTLPPIVNYPRFNVTPEPGTATLLGIFASSLLLRRRRTKI